MTNKTLSFGTLLVFVFSLFQQSIALAFIGSPTIQLAPAAPLIKGKPYTIKASVHDDYGVDKVILHYRAIGETEFSTRPMKRHEQSEVYSATLAPADIPEPGIQYYVRAVSMSGAISAMPDLRQTTIEVVFAHLKGNKQKGSGTKWLLIGLGALAIGALAAGGGGNGSSSGDSVGGPTADVTISTSLPPDNR